MVAEYPAWPERVPFPPEQEEECRQTVREVLETRAGSDWSEAGALLAAEYATTTARVAAYNSKLDAEGPVLESVGSTGQTVLKEHPLIGVQMKLSTRQIALARSLGFTGLPTAQGARQGIIAHGQKITSRHPDEEMDLKDPDTIDWVAIAEAEKKK